MRGLPLRGMVAMSVCSSAVLASTPMVPVYVRSGNGTLEVHQTSVRPGTGYAGVVTALEHGAMPHGGCSSANTVFDFGFFDGADSCSARLTGVIQLLVSHPTSCS
mmetsp:Transcript_44497/g.100586  ORF Transcript_44497/g.100586 Transcript_44497/m.100586 type:complete len:105 (-) Transcript_44497:1-315(-)